MINETIMDYVVDQLQDALIDSIHLSDPARAGVVMKGPLQGDPDPDQARISVTVHDGDPDEAFPGMTTTIKGAWNDEIEEMEIGGSGAIIWNRRFTVKARVLLVNTGEALQEAKEIASTVKTRIEKAIINMPFSDISSEGEFVVRPAASEYIQSELIQSGGPPDSYDFHIKVRFDVQTSQPIG